jgi:hypothetical protein
MSRLSHDGFKMLWRDLFRDHRFRDVWHHHRAHIAFFSVHTTLGGFTVSNITTATLGTPLIAALLFADADGNPPAVLPVFTTPGTFALTDPTGAAVDNTVAADGMSTQFTPTVDGVYNASFSGVDSDGTSWTGSGSITITDGTAVSVSIVFSTVRSTPANAASTVVPQPTGA